MHNYNKLLQHSLLSKQETYELNLTTEKIETCLLSSRSITSLNSLTNRSDNPSELLEIIEPEDREILILKFNLNNEVNPPTLHQISDRLNISLEQLRTRCNRAINNLRKSKGVHQLKQFI